MVVVVVVVVVGVNVIGANVVCANVVGASVSVVVVVVESDVGANVSVVVVVVESDVGGCDSVSSEVSFLARAEHTSLCVVNRRTLLLGRAHGPPSPSNPSSSTLSRSMSVSVMAEVVVVVRVLTVVATNEIGTSLSSRDFPSGRRLFPVDVSLRFFEPPRFSARSTDAPENPQRFGRRVIVVSGCEFGS